MTDRMDKSIQWLQLATMSFGVSAVLGDLQGVARPFAIIGVVCLIPCFVWYIPTGITFSEADD